jgi:hypothetical protein
MVAQLDREFIKTAPGRAASRLVAYTFFEGRPATTKGRWLNPAVFANLHFATHLPWKRVDGPMFIVGMGRSGTTLLGRILATHPDVGFLNEPKAMWHVIRDDEDIIGSYAPPLSGRLYLDVDDANEEVVKRSHALFAWYRRASKSARVVDKYPELVFRHAFVRAVFPDARFIVAVRGPWATLSSVAGWSKTHASHNADWWGVRDQKWSILWSQGVAQKTANADIAQLNLNDEDDHFIRAAVEWVVTMREAISLAAADPRAMLIAYERLIQDPGGMVGEILDFCQLPLSPRTTRYAETVVSSQDHDDHPEAIASRLPDALTKAIELTWSQLRALYPHEQSALQ